MDAAQITTAGSLEDLREAAAGCRACAVEARHADVFGEGRESARLMLVGEQPGDREDIECQPFVGPAGRVLDQALAEAGMVDDLAGVARALEDRAARP